MILLHLMMSEEAAVCVFRMLGAQVCVADGVGELDEV